MALYEYKARNRRGEAMLGTLEAESAERVAEQLFNTGMTPIDISERKAAGPKVQGGGLMERMFRPGVKIDELIMLCRQLHTLMKAGVPILRGLSSLTETTRNPTLSAALGDITENLQSGRELHSALARHSKIFSPLFVSIVQVGESTGRMDQAFAQLAEYLELEKETRDRIKAALRYPMIVIFTIVIAMGIINVMVIPAFADAFNRFNAELPLMTRVLIGVSDFTVNYWWLILFALIAGIMGFSAWKRTENGQYAWSRSLLKIPLVGGILLRSVLGRFSRSLALSLRSGVPLVRALTVIGGVVNNAYVSERVMSMRDGIESGDSISRTAAATGLFTPLVLQMISIGEESGAVDDLLLETAEHYEAEVKYELKRLSDAIEPIIIVIIGAMVLVLALGVFLPLWDLSSAMRG